jgi:carbonic anhydrase/acetyltransferase-like protein (isoleucine patch superfamily)
MGLLRRGEPFVPGLTAGAGNGGIGDGSDGGIAFLAPCATLIGNVRLSSDVSIFYKALLKADVAAYGVGTVNTPEEERRWRSLPIGGHERKLDAGMLDSSSGIGHPTIGGANGGGIYVGVGTNIQDGCIVTSYEGHATIGDYVTVGHAAHIHSATVGDECLIGMGAILKPGSIVERHSFVAAGSVIERGQLVKEGELWGGNPARKLRDLSSEERVRLRIQAEKYIDVARSHGHVMELGGNVPDSYILQYGDPSLGTGVPSAPEDVMSGVESNSKWIELPTGHEETNIPAPEDGSKEGIEGIDRQPYHDSQDADAGVTNELRARVKDAN